MKILEEKPMVPNSILEKSGFHWTPPGKCFAEQCGIHVWSMLSQAGQPGASAAQKTFSWLLLGKWWDNSSYGEEHQPHQSAVPEWDGIESLCQEMGNGREGRYHNEVEFIITPSGRTFQNILVVGGWWLGSQFGNVKEEKKYWMEDEWRTTSSMSWLMHEGDVLTKKK